MASRQSLAPQRLLKEAAPSKGRASMAPGAMGLQLLPDARRSSAFGKPAGAKHDPRPLNDKNWMAACIRTVITYLTTHTYPFAISPKTLQTPTGKEFAQLVQFLFAQFDPVLAKSLGKIEDEVPQFLKRLNYPFTISKSALFAVGSPHSWPAVLGALTWLVELLNYEERAEEPSAAAFDERQRNERDFYAYVAASYRSFLAGDDLKCAAADEEMVAQLRASMFATLPTRTFSLARVGSGLR